MEGWILICWGGGVCAGELREAESVAWSVGVGCVAGVCGEGFAGARWIGGDEGLADAGARSVLG